MRRICSPMQKGGVLLCITKGQHESKRVDQAQPKVEAKQDQRPVVKCQICGKPHPTHKCWNNPDNKRVAYSAQFDSQYKGDTSNWGQDRNFDRSDQRDNHFNNNYRTDHQVNFCKIESLDVGKGQAKLAEIRRREESGSVTKSRSFSSGETKFILMNGLIYRHFKKNAKVSLQLVVPSSLTHSVRNLAHESLRV